MDFRGKVALISGASRGVGFATAKNLAQRGVKLVISARGEKRLESARAELAESGAEVFAVAGDVGNQADAAAMVQTAIDHFGRLDVLVNNAGVSMRGDFSDLAPAVCQQVIATNLMGSVNLSRAAVAHLIASRGHMVFISSIAGLFGLPGASVYCASKKALSGLAESLRLELIPEGVHVGVVYLGFTEHDPEKRILMADGSQEHPGRPAHHTQAQAAELIVDMIQKRKRSLIMTPVGHLGAWIYRLWPGLLERTILWARKSRWGLYDKFS